MPATHRYRIHALLAVVACALTGHTQAGPPFVTDDPEPVELHHWEIYFATQQYHTSGDWSGTAPHLELNFGVLPDTQLHLIAPIAYDHPSGGPSHIGYGDTELGIKYRFVQETESMPQIGVFPLVELPSGNARKGLGNGQAQWFLPLWLQKKFGDWTTYGGGGYWFNPGHDNRNYVYAGWEIQRKLSESFSAGMEIQFRTADTVTANSRVALNAGGMWDLSENHHLLFSAGHSLNGPGEFQAYLAYQFTFGPGNSKPSASK